MKTSRATQEFPKVIKRKKRTLTNTNYKIIETKYDANYKQTQVVLKLFLYLSFYKSKIVIAYANEHDKGLTTILDTEDDSIATHSVTLPGRIATCFRIVLAKVDRHATGIDTLFRTASRPAVILGFNLKTDHTSAFWSRTKWHSRFFFFAVIGILSYKYFNSLIS